MRAGRDLPPGRSLYLVGPMGNRLVDAARLGLQAARFGALLLGNQPGLKPRRGSYCKGARIPKLGLVDTSSTTYVMHFKGVPVWGGALLSRGVLINWGGCVLIYV